MSSNSDIESTDVGNLGISLLNNADVLSSRGSYSEPNVVTHDPSMVAPRTGTVDDVREEAVARVVARAVIGAGAGAGAEAGASTSFETMNPLPTVSNTFSNSYQRTYNMAMYNSQHNEAEEADGVDSITRTNPLFNAARYSRLREVNSEMDGDAAVRNSSHNDDNYDEDNVTDARVVNLTYRSMERAHNIVQSTYYRNVERTVDEIYNKNVDGFNDLSNEITKNIENRFENKIFFNLANKMGINLEELIDQLDKSSKNDIEEYALNEEKIDKIVHKELQSLTDDLELEEGTDRIEYMSKIVGRYRNLVTKHFDNIINYEIRIKSATKHMFKLTTWLKSIHNITNEILYEFDENSDVGSEGDGEDGGDEGDDGGDGGDGEDGGDGGDYGEERVNIIDGDSRIEAAIAVADEVENADEISEAEAVKEEHPIPEIQHKFYKSVEDYSRHLINKIDTNGLVFKFNVSKKCFNELIKLGHKINGLQTSHLCIICTNKPVDTVIIPCGHTCCGECLHKLNRVTDIYSRKCYVCKEQITNYQKIYFM